MHDKPFGFNIPFPPFPSILYDTDCFLYLFHLCPDVGYHESAAVPPYGVLEDVGQFGLPIWNVVTMSLSEGQGDLLQKGQGLVDILGLTFSVLGSLK